MDLPHGHGTMPIGPRSIQIKGHPRPPSDFQGKEWVTSFEAISKRERTRMATLVGSAMVGGPIITWGQRTAVDVARKKRGSKAAS